MCAPRLPRRLLAAGALCLALLVGLTPLALALNSAFFTDVTNPPYDDEMVSAIDAMKVAGITVGCNPPANDHYCPEGFVSRWQMALFLARGLGLEGTPAPNTYVGKARTVDDYAITATKLATGSVGTLALADGAVTTGKLSATGALSGSVLTANGVGGASFQSGAAWSLSGN